MKKYQKYQQNSNYNQCVLPPIYNPQEVEDFIYQKWESSGYFNPDNLPFVPEAKQFTISMPPPNVTGVLHLGHSLFLTLQDIMIRYHRMKQEKTLWLPGVDHAAIATQNAVEKELKKQGKTRFDFSQDEFKKLVEEHIKKTRSTIEKQIRQMGASCDWSRERYTMDKGLTKAVQEVFVKMFDEGLIYHGERIVNWCPRCNSTLADDEVEYQQIKGKLYYIKYHLLNPKSKIPASPAGRRNPKQITNHKSQITNLIIVATTRPETKIGDSGIAVHPQDKRYQKFIGKTFKVKLGKIKTKVKIFADKAVDPEFGTGAIGVTPAHSMIDFEWAKKYNLEIKKIIDEKGKMTKEAGLYAGLKVLEAREKFLADLKEAGLLEKVEDYEHSLSICYRCEAPIEPLPSKQWFVAVDKKFTIKNKSLVKYFGKKETTLKEIATWAVKVGEIKIIPQRFNKIYFHWMKNLHDWCISRQIWFGHKIPVWYKKQKATPIYRDKNQKPIEITYFVHGTTTDNERNRQTGWRKGELSKLGKQQNLKLKKIIQQREDKYDLIFCSDLKRAWESAKTIFGDKYKIIKDKRLRECNYGDLNGKNKSEFKDDKFYINNPHPNGESYKEVEERIKDFLDEIKDKYPGRKIAILGHKIPQIALEVLLNKKTWEEAIDDDWRKRKAWQAGWQYFLDGQKKLGFYEKVVPQVFAGKTKTYRLRDHHLKVGGYLTFENSQTGEIFGYGTITNIVQTTVGKVPLDDPAHGATYKRRRELIKAFKRHYPEYDVMENTEVFIYTYKFTPAEEIYVGVNPPKGKGWVQDRDTLDTWFSSSLWTFSSLGWPKNCKQPVANRKWGELNDLEKFHPTSVLETGYEILFFWVARMIMMTYYVLEEKPFEIVYLHGIVRDRKGRKMTKSKPETCIDPITVIRKYGTDALRLSLVVGNTPGCDMRIYEEKIAGFRNFVNKLWNIGRFIIYNYLSAMSSRPNGELQITNKKNNSEFTFKKSKLALSDKWILSRLNSVIQEVTRDLENFRFSRGIEKLYEFTWHELADWYIEIYKILKLKMKNEKLKMRNKNKNKKIDSQSYIPYSVFCILLKLWHPFTPFVTEYLYGKLKNKKELVITNWPQANKKYINEKTEKEFDLIQEMITTIRNFRAKNKIEPKKILKVQVSTKKLKNLITKQKEIIEKLAKIELKFNQVKNKKPDLKLNQVEIYFVES